MTIETPAKASVKYDNAIVTVMVSDMGRALRFYVEALGLKEVARYGDNWAEIAAPGVRIGLHPGRKASTESREISIGLQVSNIEAATDALAAKGVKLSPIRDDTFIRLAHFMDPDGNALYLCEVKRWS